MENIVVTGAGSGLGKAFVEIFSSSASDSTHIFAVDMKFVSADVSKSFPDSGKPVKWMQSHVHQYTVDISNPEETVGLGQLLDLDERAVDVLVHCAATRAYVSGKPLTTAEELKAADSWDVMDKATMDKAFAVNTTGALLVIQALMPSLKRAAAKAGGKPGPRAVALGSRVGSMTDNSSGGMYAYRASKAALHAVIKSFSVDVPDVVFAVLHPGIVATGLEPMRAEGAQEPREAAQKLADVTTALMSKDTGRFIDRFGNDLPW